MKRAREPPEWRNVKYTERMISIKEVLKTRTISTLPVYEWTTLVPEFEEMTKRYVEQIKQIANAYVDDCICNNIENYSAYGWFLETVYIVAQLSRQKSKIFIMN